MSPRLDPRERPRDLLALLTIAVAFLIAHQVGLRTISPLSPLSPLWPPAGVLLASFMLLRRPLWPAAVAVVAGTDALSHVLVGARVWVGLAYLVPSLIELAVALWIIRRLAGPRVDFRRVRDTFALVGGAVAGAGVSGAVAGGLAVVASGAPFVTSAVTWWAADVLGMLLLTPMIIAWVRGPWSLKSLWSAGAVEGTLFMAFWTWTADRTFRGEVSIGWLELHPYMLAPFMVWAALRLGVRGATAAMTSVAAVAVHVVLTQPALFPLGGANVSEQLLLVQVYLAAMGLTGLLLASALAERATAARAARESGDRLRVLADNLPNRVIFQLARDPDGSRRFLYVSANAQSVLGVTADELLADSARLTQLLSAGDRERLAAAELESERRHREFSIETHVHVGDGQERWLQLSASPRWLETEQLVWDGIALDITERRRDEQRLRRTNRTLRTISHCNQVLVRERTEDALLQAICQVIVEHGGFLLAWVGYADHDDQQRVRPVGYAGVESGYLEGIDVRWDDSRQGSGPTGLAIRTGRAVVSPEMLTDPSAAPWQAEARARGYRSSLALPLRDGARVFGALSVYAPDVGVFDAEEVAHLTELADDLAYGILALRARVEHARAEEALGASEERFRQLAENIREIFWMLDARTNELLYVSPGVERLYGISVAEFQRAPTAIVTRIHPDDRDRVIAASRAVKAGRELDEEYRLVDERGGVQWVHGRAFPVRDASGDVYRIVGISDDITARKRIEEQLRQVQKLEAIGQLAGGIAHDFNNILAAIMMQAGMARGLTGLPAEASELLQDIDAAAQRAANLTRQLLLFSRKQAMQERPVELNDLVATVMRMLKRVVPEHVQLHVSLHPRALVVQADPGMLEQVVMNLTVNARDAMPDGGVLSIETFSREVTTEEARGLPGATGGPYVGLRVRDTGGGIDPQLLGNIFDPFFSTKEPGKGTGLGLSTVFGIVQQHRGTILVDSAPGHGTTMEVLFPSHQLGVVAPPLPEPAVPATTTATHTILVVEDDRSVRALTQRILERQGYRVHIAASGREALDEWERYSPSIDLLLTDLVMPGGVGGVELAEVLQARSPGLRVVYSSGYDPNHGTRAERLEPGVNFLQKPATPRQILAVVGQMLAPD